MNAVQPDNSKHYLTTEPFFISDKTGRIEILREANFWSNPVKEHTK